MCFCLLRWIFYLCAISSFTHLEVCCACRWRRCWSLYHWVDNESKNQIVGKLRWCKGLCGCAAASSLHSWSNWFWRAHVQGRKKIVRRDQRQTLYCHITGPCCILNSTNLSKQSDKILRWRDALLSRSLSHSLAPSPLLLPLSTPPVSSARSLLQSKSKVVISDARAMMAVWKHWSTKGKNSFHNNLSGSWRMLKNENRRR